MLNPSLFQPAVVRIRAFQKARVELQGLSNAALAASKRAIFAWHREDPAGAKKELAAAKKELSRGISLVKKDVTLGEEGTWRVALEEYTEAYFVSEYFAHGTIRSLPPEASDPDILFGALSDLAGECVRRAVRLATNHDARAVERMLEDVRGIVELLLQMDLTGHLRAKVDQAKQHLRKLEEIRYDLAMHGGK